MTYHTAQDRDSVQRQKPKRCRCSATQQTRVLVSLVFSLLSLKFKPISPTTRAVNPLQFLRLKLKHCWCFERKRIRSLGPNRMFKRAGEENSGHPLFGLFSETGPAAGWHILGGLDRLIGGQSNIPQLGTGKTVEILHAAGIESLGFG